jgi:hypothetical protein
MPMVIPTTKKNCCPKRPLHHRFPSIFLPKVVLEDKMENFSLGEMEKFSKNGGKK